MPFRNLVRVSVGLCFLRSLTVSSLEHSNSMLAAYRFNSGSHYQNFAAPYKNGSTLSSLTWSRVLTWFLYCCSDWGPGTDEDTEKAGTVQALRKLCQYGSLPTYNHPSVPALSLCRRQVANVVTMCGISSDADKHPVTYESHKLCLTCESSQNVHVRINE